MFFVSPYAISSLNYIRLYSDKEVYGLQLHNKTPSYLEGVFHYPPFICFNLSVTAS